ncbi:membrane peptidoglycan carboxypeptidase [Cryobacterium sp. MP_M3]|uniref:transglycosylase domain-containing protein n=1 Tax=unclassified Cryobacterium TaxID=2649013 RepID=UPI0018C938E8|nr:MULTISPECIES: transglycosylase domain-containing protein [unclassified Cryobacterium]MBG6058636.1 membrane peptidoglycan carboxypeptidase [Cryobacterium sp. MP_M3]
MSAKNRTVSGALGGFLGFVGMSAIAGILVTAAVTPALALSGMAATNTINVFENLPDYLAIDQLAQKSNVYANLTDGSPYLLASFYDQNRVEVASDAINQFVKDAAISGEDPRFYEHGGVDLQGTVTGLVTTLASGTARGGSSITQQYVKNVLVQKCEVLTDQKKRTTCYDAATETSPDRKLKEMRLAIGVEKKYPKDDILRQYLNITGFGGSVYGIEAAANYYFYTSAANLTLPQAASLVAIVNNPVKFKLDNPDSKTNGAENGYQANKQRRDYILGQMLKYKKISRADHDAAVASPVQPNLHEPSTGCQTAGGSAYFCDLVINTLQNDPTFGADESTRLANFRRGGYNIYTTLDLDLQSVAESTMKANVPSSYPGWDVGGVITSVQVGTGRVLGMAQNKDYTQDPAVAASNPNATGLNYNTDIDQGGSHGFQPGSTYKVFTLGEWLTEGHSLNERVDSRRKSDWGTFKDSCNGPQNFPGFNPKNDSNESGTNYSALESTIGSINTGFIGMAKKLDLCGIRKTAESFGVHRADLDPLQQGASAVLGTNEVAPLSMAVAFAGIANNGVTCSPIVIDRITGPDGAEIPPPKSDCKQSVDPSVDAGMTYAMQRVMSNGTATASNRATSPKVPMIGKTGTTDGNKDTWMSGASTKVATVVGVVSVTGDINQRNIFFDSGQAATARHRMWPEVMSVANAKYGGDAFAEASSKVLQAVQVPVPDLRGKTMADAQSTLESAGFSYADGGVTDSEMPAGTVARTDPAGGTSASRGATVTVYSSNGTQVVVPDVVGKTEAEARATLNGFAVTKTEQDVTDPKQVGTVVGMTPAAGSGSAPGGRVSIAVGKLGAGGKGNG